MKSVALLGIDIQIGAFDGKLLPPIHMGDHLLRQMRALIDAARDTHALIIYIQHCAAEGLLVKGTAAWAIHPSTTPINGEHVIEKRASSAFEGTTLGQTLDDEQIRTIIICGLQSEHCVLNTALDAMRRGMKVYVASDAHSTWPDGETSATETIEQINKELAESGALVAPTQAIVSMLQSRP